MIDLVAELRKRAESSIPANTDFNTGVAQGLREAADLVEADPLYKAAPKMLAFLRELGEACNGMGGYIDTYDVTGDQVRDILATLPKETCPPHDHELVQSTATIARCRVRGCDHWEFTV